MAKSFSQRMTDGQLLAAGIKAHAAALAGVSLGVEQAENIEKLSSDLCEINVRQEKLKADLKSCTAELAEKSKEFDSATLDAKKRVKLLIPQPQWKEFGILDVK